MNRTRMSPIPSIVAACAAAVASALPARADVIPITRTTQGWYTDSGVHIQGNLNTFTGKDTSTVFGMAPQGTYRYNSFFVFSLSTVSTAATSAAINFFVSGVFNGDPSYAFSMFDVSTNPNTLDNAHSHGSNQGQSVYTDLGSGTNYANFSVEPFMNGQQFHVSLNSAGLAGINSHLGGTFAVGISYTGSYLSSTGPEGVVFGADFDPAPRLVVGTNGSDISSLLSNPVPLPHGASLACAGLALLALRRPRRQHG